MSARLVGVMHCTLEPETEGQNGFLDWLAVFAVVRVCPRCLHADEILLPIKIMPASGVVLAMRAMRGLDPHPWDVQGDVMASAGCGRCVDSITVTDRDVSKEVMDEALAKVSALNADTVKDILDVARASGADRDVDATGQG